MKKTSILLLLLLSSVYGWAERYYESNALGLPIREIREFRTDEFEYVLMVEEHDDKTVKTLLMDEQEYKRWELQYSEGMLVSEIVYFEGVLSESRVYDLGALVEETLYEDETVAEKRIYDYSAGYLKEVRAVDGDDNPLYVDVYERSRAGRLRRINRISDDEKDESSFIYSDGELVEEWHGNDEEGVLFRYHDGEKLAEETWEGLKLMLAEEVRMFEGKKEVVVEDKELGTTTTRYYDEEDRLQIERTETDDDLLEHVRYDYQEEKVTKKTSITRSEKEDVLYEYDENGEVIQETLMRNTWIEKVIVHTGKDEYYEEIYREGKPALRVYFEDGAKVDEVFLFE